MREGKVDKEKERVGEEGKREKEMERAQEWERVV